MVVFEFCKKTYKKAQPTSSYLPQGDKEEWKWLLALDSGCVNVRQGCCPIPRCGKENSRIERYLNCHRVHAQGQEKDDGGIKKKKKKDYASSWETEDLESCCAHGIHP